MSRNWTKEETELFCEVLVDPVNNFLETLEKKALKKSSTKEVFEAILDELKTEMLKEEFIIKNDKNFNGKKKKRIDMIFDTKKLQQKYTVPVS